MIDEIQRTMDKHRTEYTEIKCALCRRFITNNQLSFSMKRFNQPLCMSCQSLQRFYGGKK